MDGCDKRNGGKKRSVKIEEERLPDAMKIVKKTERMKRKRMDRSGSRRRKLGSPEVTVCVMRLGEWEAASCVLCCSGFSRLLYAREKQKGYRGVRKGT